ncbi:MAG TPA: response regulator [Actinomycetes bacterium]|nr:response regulator [Actinomycetes bacterium]
MTRVLLVEDEPQILRALRITLQARRYDVSVATDGSSALSAASRSQHDLVVLDLGLPDLDGVDLIRRLRTRSAVPIVVLSGRATSHDKVDALDAGADDYVTKPFSVDELLARIRAVTRRRPRPEEGLAPVEIGHYRVDFASRTVSCTDATMPDVRLTPTEWELLGALARTPGRLVSQRELLRTVWGPGNVAETHYLRQYMARLRTKLEEDPARPRHLVTEAGMGYRFLP